MIGTIFGKLTVIERAQNAPGRRGTFWICACECGKTTVAYQGHLKAGERVSCGCKTDGNRKHGRSHTPEHRCWTRMKERCFNTHNKKFPLYGGRGITVCDRWRNSFEAFFADMGPRPSPRHSVERNDSDGNYEPSNCRWATYVEQNNNRPGFNRRLIVSGRSFTVAEASREFGIPHPTILGRLDRGWSDEEAVSNG